MQTPARHGSTPGQNPRRRCWRDGRSPVAAAERAWLDGAQPPAARNRPAPEWVCTIKLPCPQLPRQPPSAATAGSSPPRPGLIDRMANPRLQLASIIVTSRNSLKSSCWRRTHLSHLPPCTLSSPSCRPVTAIPKGALLCRLPACPTGCMHHCCRRRRRQLPTDLRRPSPLLCRQPTPSHELQRTGGAAGAPRPRKLALRPPASRLCTLRTAAAAPEPGCPRATQRPGSAGLQRGPPQAPRQRPRTLW